MWDKIWCPGSRLNTNFVRRLNTNFMEIAASFVLSMIEIIDKMTTRKSGTIANHGTDKTKSSQPTHGNSPSKRCSVEYVF